LKEIAKQRKRKKVFLLLQLGGINFSPYLKRAFNTFTCIIMHKDRDNSIAPGASH
jgi:hypothetical protein